MKTVRARIAVLMAAAAFVGACQAAKAEDMDGILAQMDRAPLMAGFCQIADENRAGLHLDASLDPARVSAFVLRSAENAVLTEKELEAAGATSQDDWIVHSAILQTETRYFVLVADPARPAEACAIKDLGVRA